jgi:hypothetical protein
MVGAAVESVSARQRQPLARRQAQSVARKVAEAKPFTFQRPEHRRHLRLGEKRERD